MPRHKKSEYLSSFRRLVAWEDYKANVEYRKSRRSCERRHVPFVTDETSSGSSISDSDEEDIFRVATNVSSNNASQNCIKSKKIKSLSTSPQHADCDHTFHAKTKASDTVADCCKSFPSIDCATFDMKGKMKTTTQKHETTSPMGDGRQIHPEMNASTFRNGACIKKTPSGTTIKEINGSCGNPRLQICIHGRSKAGDQTMVSSQKNATKAKAPRSVRVRPVPRAESVDPPPRRVFHPFGHAHKDIPGSATGLKRTFNVLANRDIHPTALQALEKRNIHPAEKVESPQFNDKGMLLHTKNHSVLRKSNANSESARNNEDSERTLADVEWCSEYQSRYPLYKVDHYETALKDKVQSHKLHMDRDLNGCQSQRREVNGYR